MKLQLKTKSSWIIIAGTIAGCLISCGVNAGSTVSTMLTAVSDYVADGVSQSDSKPVLQIGVDYKQGDGLYAGIWGSRIDNDAPQTPNMELDYAGGFTRDAVKGLTYDLGATKYTYHHVNDKDITDYFEWYAGITVLENTSFYYYYADDEKVWNGIQRRMILSHQQPLMDNLSLNMVAERLSYEDSFGEDYNAYQIGLSKNWMDFDISLSYWDNNIHDGGDTTNERFVLEISRSFDLLEIE